MTRFARVRGFKSSKAHIPEDSTPWDLLKPAKKDSQSHDSNEATQDSSGSHPNWKQVINNEEQAQRNVQSEWAEFEEPLVKRQKVEEKASENSPQKPKKCKEVAPLRKQSLKEEVVTIAFSRTKPKVHNLGKPVKKRKFSCEFEVKSDSSFTDVEKSEPPKKSRIHNEKAVQNHFESKTDVSLENEMGSDKEPHKPFRKPQRDHPAKKPRNIPRGNTSTDGKLLKNSNPNKMIVNVNGRDIELERFGGYFVKKEDAANLKKLKKSLEAKGLSQEQITAALILERRRAEKSLSREKKKRCFHCRKPGHSFAECPENSSAGSELVSVGVDVCYKCGSTEHKSFKCRSVEGDKYGFATCFICKETGHISKQCPDNPRGLYPNGGACRLCGDVTHFRRNCPRLQEERAEAAITLNSMDGGNVEALDFEPSVPKSSLENTVKKNKLIKF